MIVTQEQYAKETIEQYGLKVKATDGNGEHDLPWYVTDTCGRGRYFNSEELDAFAVYLDSGQVWEHDTLETIRRPGELWPLPPEQTANKDFSTFTVADWLVTAKTAVAEEYRRYCVAMAALFAYSS